MKVYKKINEAQAELNSVGIGKNSQGYQFKFRGIDAVYNIVGPIMTKHGLAIFPRVLDKEYHEKRSGNGGLITHAILTVAYDIVCVEDGSTHQNPIITVGEAMDSSDKATNKALSNAYKYALFELFCIPLVAIDVEEDNIKPKEGNAEPARIDLITEEQVTEIRNLIKSLKLEEEDICARVRVDALEDLESGRYERAINYLNGLKTEDAA